MTDITFNLDGVMINLRAGAFVRSGSKLLLCRLPDRDWWFVPGGRVKPDESSVVAIRRELSEEIGDQFQIEGVSICSENFYTLDGRQVHEICMYYNVQWLANEAYVDKRSHEYFQWVDLAQIEEINLKPEFLKKYSGRTGADVHHVIYRAGEQGA